MVRLEFSLSDQDMDRLWAIKAAAAERDPEINDMSGNEYARQLLEAELYRLHPAAVVQEDV